MTINIDQDNLTARVFHGLKSLFTSGDTLPPRYLEFAICKAFELEHVGDGNFYADGYSGEVQASIKTRMVGPHVLKTKKGRDFQTNPEKFLGPKENKKQKEWTAGIEIVQRRQHLDFKNDSTKPARDVGEQTLTKFLENINESYEKYQTTQSVEIVCIHGYSSDLTSYIVSVFWQEYQPLDSSIITWKRTKNSVVGYQKVDGVAHKVCERVNGNAKREATCFKEFKNLNNYTNSMKISVPIPSPWEFNQETILTEIKNL